MDLSVKSREKTNGIRKYSFNRISFRKDGLFVQIHHTLPGSSIPIHFLHSAFQEFDDILAISDIKGNIFIIDLTHNKFWTLPTVSECTTIAFSTFCKYELFVASSECCLKIINFENGKETGSLRGHTLPPTQLSFGGEGGKMLLSCATCTRSVFEGRQKETSSISGKGSPGEVIVWDLTSRTEAHRLNVRPDCGVKQAIFMPGVSSGHVLVCFEDDAMFVWQFGIFECVKQILPMTGKKDHHLVKTIACTRNGRAMVVGGKSHSLVAFSLDTWEIVKVIELPDGVCGVKQLEFLPQPFDGGANSVLAILSSNSCVLFLDINSSSFVGKMIKPERSKIRKFVCSASGRHVACVLQSGEVNIYSGAQLLDDGAGINEVQVRTKTKNDNTVDELVDIASGVGNLAAPREQENASSVPASNKPPMAGRKKHFSRVTKEIRSELNPKRLRPLLRQYGEFPSRYRTVAWRTALLQLPSNHKAYASLIARGIHPSHAHIQHQYPLENQSELKNLRKLLSCLAHWSPLFSQVSYLPLFTYPFMKLFIHDPLACFEAVATIIINYCQHWFEFFPFPPINVLAAIENLIAQHDHDLLDFFMKNNVDTRVYAWPMLQVAFSEVLSNQEWLRFWDHVLINEPSFLLSAVPAYCIVCRTALLSCKNMDDFQFFFRNQNPINMEKFIAKIYFICQNTPAEFHPRRYLHDFQRIEEGDTYPVFNQYPKILIDTNAEKIKRIQLDEEDLIHQELETFKILKEKEERRLEAENARLKQKYLKEMEKAYQKALQIEEDKFSRRLMELANLKRQVAEAANADTRAEEELSACAFPNLIGQTAASGSKQKMPSQYANKKSAFQEKKRNGSDRDFPKGHIRTSARNHIHNDVGTQLEKEVESVREKLKGFVVGKDLSNRSISYSDHDQESLSSIGRDDEEKESEYKGWFGMRNKGDVALRRTESTEKVCGEAVKPVLGSSGPKARSMDKIGFSRNDVAQRWKIDSSNYGDFQPWRHLDVSSFSSVRNDDIYQKEQDAIIRAMEARASVL